MICSRLAMLLAFTVCLTSDAAHANLVASPQSADAADSQEQATDSPVTSTVAQVLFVSAVIVLVLLVLVLIAGFFVYAADNETPEQRLERQIAKERIKHVVIAVGAYHVTKAALEKLK